MSFIVYKNTIKKILSQSDIFNRLPISNDQKAQLYDALLQEQRDQTNVTNVVPCEFPEISNCYLGPDSLNDEPHTELECPANSSQTHVEPIAHSQVGSPERGQSTETEFVEHR